MQHLNGHVAVVLDVVREVHGGHAAGAELVVEPVAAFEGGGQTRQHRIAHLIPAAAISRFTSSTQFSTTIGAPPRVHAACFTNTKCWPSRDTS